jgi:outer membrane murein-binding lipoprotein Lpp
MNEKEMAAAVEQGIAATLRPLVAKVERLAARVEAAAHVAEAAKTAALAAREERQGRARLYGRLGVSAEEVGRFSRVKGISLTGDFVEN